MVACAIARQLTGLDPDMCVLPNAHPMIACLERGNRPLPCEVPLWTYFASAAFAALEEMYETV